MDETKKKKAIKQDSRQLNTRFLLFALVMITFGILVYGIYQLQIVEGAEHAQLTGASAVKSIPIKGVRGMITDKNSVVLARSEKVYNVTFYREEDDWDYPTKMLLEPLSILQRPTAAPLIQHRPHPAQRPALSVVHWFHVSAPFHRFSRRRHHTMIRPPNRFPLVSDLQMISYMPGPANGFFLISIFIDSKGAPSA